MFVKGINRKKEQVSEYNPREWIPTKNESEKRTQPRSRNQWTHRLKCSRGILSSRGVSGKCPTQTFRFSRTILR